VVDYLVVGDRAVGSLEIFEEVCCRVSPQILDKHTFSPDDVGRSELRHLDPHGVEVRAVRCQCVKITKEEDLPRVEVIQAHAKQLSADLSIISSELTIGKQ